MIKGMQKIGIIGSGGIGQAFAGHAAKAGYEIIISNSRGPESLSEVVKRLGGNTVAGTLQEAASADVIFLAVPWKSIPEVVSSVSSWDDRIVIDPSNPIIMPGFRVAELNGKMSSEVVTELIPGARLVKAFNTLPTEILAAAPDESGGRRVIFYAGNDAPAKKIVAAIIEKMGFAGIDLGHLNEGGKLQHFPNGPLTSLNLIQL